MRSQCFICGQNNPNVLQNHHIVPQRYGGSDGSENVTTLCANCHQAVEAMYGKRFYHTLGVERDERIEEPERGPESSIERFVNDRLVADSHGFVGKDRLREAYRKYAEQKGFPAFSPGVLGRTLCQLDGWEINPSRKQVEGGRKQVYRGVRFSDEPQQ